VPQAVRVTLPNEVASDVYLALLLLHHASRTAHRSNERFLHVSCHLEIPSNNSISQQSLLHGIWMFEVLFIDKALQNYPLQILKFPNILLRLFKLLLIADPSQPMIG
jgi:hypothetical protein